MIRCTLELLPGGDDEKPIRLGVIHIDNMLVETIQTDGKKGTYRAQIFKRRKKPSVETTVRNFPRLSYHPWNLVRRVLNQAAAKNGGTI